MPRPNFWRLKRKQHENSHASVEHPPKISQKTISSFFGTQNPKPNLLVGKVNQTSEDAELASPKRAKLEADANASSISEVHKIQLSNSAMDKLKSFSMSSIGINNTQNQLEFRSICSSGNASLYPEKDKDHERGASCSGSSFSDSDQSGKHPQLKSFHSKYGSKLSSAPTKKMGKVKFTPLEQQVMDIKREHPDVLLFVECGYKYRFFGEDAEVAAKELNIFAHLDHNFMTASIPVHRLHAHVSRLVEKGFKVGVVKQMETAALKAISDNKNAPFSRKLDQIYTRATLIGEDLEPMDHQNIDFKEGISSGFIMCLNEGVADQSLINIAFVSVNPSTGECVHATFKDNICREELHKYLQIFNPAEILVPISVSSNTERLLVHLDARLERLSDSLFDVTDVVTKVIGHFVSEMGENCTSDMVEGLTEMSPLTLCCFAALQSHLSEFGLQRVIRPNGIQGISSVQNSVRLDASTIRNLQLFRSDSGTVHGSLFWALNHTKTKFGARLLHKWLSEPIADLDILEERQDAIGELLLADQALLTPMIALLSNLPDLDKGLTTILHNRCNPAQYLNILEALCQVCTVFSSLAECVEHNFKVSLIREVVINTVDLLSNVQSYKENINVQAAKDGDKTKLLKDFSAFPNVLKLFNDIREVTSSLDKLRPDIARKLSLMSVSYVTVSGQEYLIEVKNQFLKCVPSNWRKISSTKQLARYRPPTVDALFNELQRLQDRLHLECQLAWLELMQEFSQLYYNHKQAVQNIATIDVLLSLAYVAQQEGFCRPKLIKSDNAKIIIKQGRHPVVPLLFGSTNQFVPNDTLLDSTAERCMVLSGPNMGGKSCYIRQVALIAVMAHIGSYVPAVSAEISLLESIHTRMGARDELFQGRSTLMVELAETAAILQQVSRRSLVLLDELGRGTSSCDGAAIACATLHHIVLNVQCLTLFVTHYPAVMTMVSELDNKAVNYHMAFILHDDGGEEFLTFLYEVVRGAADRSYGINVARLANLPKQILHCASNIAHTLESETLKRRDLRKTFLRSWLE